MQSMIQTDANVLVKNLSNASLASQNVMEMHKLKRKNTPTATLDQKGSEQPNGEVPGDSGGTSDQGVVVWEVGQESGDINCNNSNNPIYSEVDETVTHGIWYKLWGMQRGMMSVSFTLSQ